MPVRISARHALSGIIFHMKKGAVNAQATTKIAPAVSSVSIVTMDALVSLGLEKSQKAFAVIKAFSVMVGVDS